jgi:two-component system, NtrC family, response regulator AtoC
MSVMPNGHSIILGEDDSEVCKYLEMALQYQGYSVEVAQNGQEVLACFQGREAPVSAVVLDAMMPGMDGIDALKEIRRFNPDVPVIMMSGTSAPAAEAMKSGANEFIAKPIDSDALRKSLKSLIEAKQWEPARSAAQSVALTRNGQVYLSKAPKMQQLQRFAASVGRSGAPVLIQGETGVGKEVLARELHACSLRAKKSFLKLNCAALPSELVESELFGYERGAFTGAFQRKPGMFELADGGTILLDEIGDMDFKLQAKLLQVLQDHEFQRLGGKDAVKVDVRVIAATHCDLEKAIVEKRFREDLYYRLNVIRLHMPALRERKEDILPLAEFFLRKHTAADMPLEQIPPALQAIFLEYHWPGNIRELENMVRKFIVFGEAEPVEWELRPKLLTPVVTGATQVATAPAADLPQTECPIAAANDTYVNGTHLNGTNGANGHSNGTSGATTPVLLQVATAKRQAERTAILAALKETKWNRKQASIQLEIDYKALLYKMKVLEIRKEAASIPAVSAAG